MNPYGWNSHRVRRFPCACGCGIEVVTRHPFKACYNSTHAHRLWDRSAKGKASRRARLERAVAARLGRVCKWCQATDREVRWSNTHGECCACARARARLSCPDCGGPVSMVTERSWCVRCHDRPPDCGEVILVDAGSDRERIVWRTLKGERGRTVTIAGRSRYVRKGPPLVVELPTKQWLRIRR